MKVKSEIFKKSGFFGLIQLLSLLFSLGKSKLVSILAGSNGIGLTGLLTSSMSLIINISNIGITNSAVKDLSVYHGNNLLEEFQSNIYVVRKLVLFSSILGFIVSIFYAFLFNTELFKSEYIFLQILFFALSIFFNQLVNGNLAIFQATGDVISISKINILGVFIGLLMSMPIIFYFRLNGILPSILSTNIVLFIISQFLIRQKNMIGSKVKFHVLKDKSKPILKLGISMAISGVVSSATIVIIQSQINILGGLKELGFYAASIGLTTSYFNLVFNAMANDYFPRLSSTVNNRKNMVEVLNGQAQVSMLIIAPLISFIIFFSDKVIKLVYTSEFLIIEESLLWISISFLLKTISWSLGFVMLAYGKSIHFLLNEVLSNIILIGSQLGAYIIWGTSGIGIGFFIYCSLHLIQMLLYNKFVFNISINHKNIKLLAFKFVLIMTLLIVHYYIDSSDILKLLCESILCVLLLIFTFKELSKIIEIPNVFRKKQSI